MATSNNRKGKLSILLLCDEYRRHANTILEHIEAFKQVRLGKVYLYNPRWMKTCKWLDLNEFDVVVIHYSLACKYDHYLPKELKDKIRAFGGLKVQYIQDDYREVDDYAAVMRYLGIHALFALYSRDKIDLVWNESRLPGVRKYTTLTGYVPESMIGIPVPPLEARPLDVGYRGRILPYWLGRLGQEKAAIGKGFLERSSRYGLACDIAWREEDRIYGQAWIRFLTSCKATLGTESGSSITDFDGSVERRVKAYLRDRPHAEFLTVFDAILHQYEGNVVNNVISPRIFESAALRTAMILFPGEYGGVIKPWVHYIPLAKDFSNMEEVAERVRNHRFLKELTERAYRDLIDSRRYSYDRMVREFEQCVQNCGISARPPEGIKWRYWMARAERPVRVKVYSLRDSATSVLGCIRYRLIRCLDLFHGLASRWFRNRSRRSRAFDK